jgi:ribosomal protein S18 acetylase RimI-like enzyme
MDNEIVVRLAERNDASVIADFNISMALETEGKELSVDVVRQGVLGLFDKPEYGFYVVAEFGGEIAGSLMITYEWSDWRSGLFWWIQSVYVRGEFRQKGVFRKMYDFLKERATQQTDICGFRLYVEKSNTIAQSTYEKTGLCEIYYRVYEDAFE